MADVNVITSSLNTIAVAAYQNVHEGHQSSRKTGHQIAFETMQGTAGQLEAILRQNPAPNRDQRENIAAQFEAMKKNLDLYCTKTSRTDDVLRAFNRASTEWQSLCAELGG